MIDNDRVGTRIKARRQELGLTLKALESRAGVSATHVSEIERGRSSPTVKALSRISEALGKDVAFFLETDELEDFSVRREADLEWRELPWGGGRFSSLAPGVPGAKLAVHRLELLPHGGPGEELRINASSVLWVESGRLRVEVNGSEDLLHEGDSLHIGVDCPFRFGNAGAETMTLVLFSGARHALPTRA